MRLDWRETFTKVLGFDPSDEAKVREAAQGLVENAATADVWVLANALFEERVEPTFDPSRPTFVFDYPSVISPLTRSYADRPEYCGRWDLFAGGWNLARPTPNSMIPWNSVAALKSNSEDGRRNGQGTDAG